jgi:hypothetical protein
MRDMNTIKGDFVDRGVTFMAVNVYEEADAALRFAESSGYDFHWARADDETAGTLGVATTPALIVVDASGKVAWRSGLFTSYRGGSDLRRALERVARD